METLLEITNIQQESIHGWYAKKMKDLLILNADSVNVTSVQLATFYLNH